MLAVPRFLLAAAGGPAPGAYSYNNCVSASDFSDSNGTRLEMASCNRCDTRQLWNLG